MQRHLEQGLNHDLSAIRIHDDSEADKLAKGVNAIAFTTGTDIYFQSGKFNPNSQSGLELLAHEVTHTVQQSKGQVGKGVDPDSGLESEARQMGRKLARMKVGGADIGARKNTKRTVTLRGAPSFARLQRYSAAQQPKGESGQNWRASGNLRGHPPVRDEKHPPNMQIVEDEKEYRTLLAGVKKTLQSQLTRAKKMRGPTGQTVPDYNYWFAKVYSFVTENEIEFAEARVYNYPSYVMQCVLYFDKIYTDNLNSFMTKRNTEEHWKNAFNTAGGMKNKDWAPFDVAPAIFSMVAAMLAHIRFDLPRAEAWVYQSYKKRYNAKTTDFQPDFFRMSAVFDRAATSMMDVIRANVDKSSQVGVDVMKNANMTDEMMRTALGGDMGLERLATWKRMEVMVQQGKIPANPYTLKDGQLIGDTTKGNPSSHLTSMGRISPNSLRPSMEGIKNSYGPAMARAAGTVLVPDAQIGTTSDEMAKLERRFGNAEQAAKVPLYDRADLLMRLSRAPAVDLMPSFGGSASMTMGGMTPMQSGGIIQLPSTRDDKVIVSVLQGAVKAGDIKLLLNIVDSYLVLAAMENKTEWTRANTILASNYYPGLDYLNAATLIRKWQADRKSVMQVIAIETILNSLPSEVRKKVDMDLRKGQ